MNENTLFVEYGFLIAGRPRLILGRGRVFSVGVRLLA
jgi:hypothetical protein